MQIYFLHTSEDQESDAADQWLHACIPTSQKIAVHQIPVSGDNKILWWHGTDRRQILSSNSQYSPAISKFLETGGRLFLSLAAVLAVIPLGLEKQSPDICEDGNYNGKTGEFEICGLMSFLGHPIFAKIGFAAASGCGIYLWKPAVGAPHWRFGYGPEKWPQGKVWGVHRFHLGFDSQRKFAWEYDVPRVLCVGAYLHFGDAANLYRQHVRAFAQACLDYLVEPLPPKRLHWQKTITAVTPLKKRPPCPAEFPAQRIKYADLTPKLEPPLDSNNFFDLSGERILLMGTERGPITEVWSHPLRLCRNLSVKMHSVNQPFTSRQIVWDNAAQAKVIIRPHHLERRSEQVVEHVWLSANHSLACIDWHFAKTGEIEVEISFEVDFRLMWPYAEGCLSEIKYAISRSGQHVLFGDPRGLFIAQFSISSAGDTPEVKDISSANRSCAGVTFRRRLDTRRRRTLQFVMIGGTADDASLRKLRRDFSRQLRQLYAGQANVQNRWIEKFAEVDTPEPDFNTAARWAKLKTAAFVCTVPSLGKSLLAGFANTSEGCPDGSGRPGYAWFFGRDACWTALAMLHYGDFDNVSVLLQFLGRHQEFTGKILHELTTSGAVHYDAADSTPLYVMLMARYLDHTGDKDFVRSQWLHVRKAMEFLLSTDRDGDGLIENTDVGHGWIEGGKLYGVHVEHYLAGCWAEALRGAAHCAAILGERVEAEKWWAHHKRVKQMLATDFWNATSGYFYHGKRTDGTFDDNITVLAAVPVLFGYGKDEHVQRSLDRLGSKNFNTDWGVRIVSDDHPLYAPQGYHYGSVWPLFTGWAALAAFKRGRPLTAMTQLKNSMRNFQHGAMGCMEEVLHGEIYRPAGVCPHQAWSEAMILQPIFEGLLGFAPRAWQHEVTLTPRLPLAWRFFSAGPLHVGAHVLAFGMARNDRELTFSLAHKGSKLLLHFVPHFPAVTQIESLLIGGQKQLLIVQKKCDEQIVPLHTTIGRDPLHLVYRIAKCWSAIAPAAPRPYVDREADSVSAPHPKTVMEADSAPLPKANREAERGRGQGERSHGFLIIRESLTPSGVRVEVEGDAGSQHRLEFVSWGYQIKAVRGGKLVSMDGERGSIDFAFGAATTKYARQAIEIDLV